MDIKKGDRISWIDVARGIGIFLIVFGHTSGGGFLTQVLYAFHVPLFFFILFSYRNCVSKKAKPKDVLFDQNKEIVNSVLGMGNCQHLNLYTCELFASYGRR